MSHSQKRYRVLAFEISIAWRRGRIATIWADSRIKTPKFKNEHLNLEFGKNIHGFIKVLRKNMKISDLFGGKSQLVQKDTRRKKGQTRQGLAFWLR